MVMSSHLLQDYSLNSALPPKVLVSLVQNLKDQLYYQFYFTIPWEQNFKKKNVQGNTFELL